jgi:hypothetical protein
MKSSRESNRLDLTLFAAKPPFHESNWDALSGQSSPEPRLEVRLRIPQV